MLAVTVEYLHGTVRATGPDDTAITGHAGGYEWPPSPMRLYSAFVAADGTGERAVATGGNTGLSLLEGQPVIHAEAIGGCEADDGGEPVVGALASAVLPRYVVADERAEGAVQSYPARRSVTVRPGNRLALHDPRVAFVWPGAAPTPDELRALRLRAARIGYLGCADSPVRVRVGTAPPDVGGLPRWRPDPAGSVEVSVATPGVLDLLDEAFDAWTGGQPRKRSWIRTEPARYRAPFEVEAAEDEAPAVWLRFERPVAGRFVLAVADALRGAVLGRVEQLLGGRGEVPAVLHGHGVDRGGEHVRWLPLPHVDHPHADGRIRGACIWLPSGTDPEVVALVRQAASSVPALAKPGVFDAGRPSPFDGTRRPIATTPWRWRGPAREWVTAFPAVHERFTKGPPGLTEVRRWCGYAGLPEPVSVQMTRVPQVPGAVDLPPAFTQRKGDPARPYSHLRLVFAEPIRGPIAVGRGRHFGLGLLAPLRATTEGGAGDG
jgi:CRISPR-associated protein Csb2